MAELNEGVRRRRTRSTRSSSSSMIQASSSSSGSDALLVLFVLLLSSLECLSLVSCFTGVTTTTTVPSCASFSPATTSGWWRHNNAGGVKSSSSSSSSTVLSVYFTGMDNYREADVMEQYLGAKRHDEMSALPDSMIETTLFVGNLCEFVSDQDLSELFTTASHFLKFVPAVVIRKPDLTSLQYGFVTFPSISEKEAARERFHGYKWRGKRLKVEPIRDFVNTKTGKSQRVRIPERMVAYVSGAVKKPALYSSSSSSSSRQRGAAASGSAQNGAFVNTMRRATAMATAFADTNVITTNKEQQPQSRDTVDDDITAATTEQEPQQQDYRKVLNHREQSEYARAVKKGYVTFNGYRKKAGSTSSLAVLFRTWCNVRYKPNIRLYKATNGHAALDQVVIDISPLALYRRRLAEQQPQQQQQQLAGGGDNVMATTAEMLFQNDLLLCKSQVRLAATKHGMVALNDNDDDHNDDNIDDSNDCITTMQLDNNVNDKNNAILQSTPPAAIMNIGIFQGERAQSKALAKELALLWEIPELTLSLQQKSPKSQSNDNDGSDNHHRSPRTRAPGRQDDDDDDDRSSSGRRRPAKTKGLSRHRTRGGGHRQSWY